MIISPRLLVRRFTPADSNDFAEILTDAETVFFEPYEVFTQEQAFAETEKLSHDERFFAVEQQETGKMIGKLYFSRQECSSIYEIGYTFNRNYWGKGYAREAVQALMQYAFTEMQATCIYATADVKNQRSCRLLEMSGFRLKSKTESDKIPVYCRYEILKDEFYEKKCI